MGSPEAFLRTVVTERPPKGGLSFFSTDVALLRVDLPTCGRLRLRQQRTCPVCAENVIRIDLVKDLLNSAAVRLIARPKAYSNAARRTSHLHRCRNL